MSGDFSPSLAHVIHKALNQQPLLNGNGLPVERGLEVLVETLPALLGRPIVHVLGNANPVIGALLANQLKQQLVLFRDPRSSTVSGSHLR